MATSKPSPPREAHDMSCRAFEENLSIERYVRGRLPETEAERFEDHYMSCPTCQRALEEAALLERGFKRYAADQATAADPSPPDTALPAAPRPGATDNLVTLSSRRRRWPSWVGGLAALLALAVGWRSLLPGFGSSVDPTTHDGISVAFLQGERSLPGDVPSHRIEQPPVGHALVLVLELAPPFYPVYEATLLRGNQVLWSRQGLALGERDSLSVSLAAELLDPGDYLLRLSAETPRTDGDGLGRAIDAGHFTFRIEPGEADPISP